MTVNFFERESKSFSWSLRIWTWKAWQAQVALSFQDPGLGAEGRDPTVTPHPWAAAEDLGDGLQRQRQKKTTGRQRASPLLAKSRSVCPKERAGSSWGALQGAGDRNVQGQRAAQAHPALRTARASQWDPLFMAGNFCYSTITPKERQGQGQDEGTRLFQSPPKLKVDNGKKKKKIQRSADSTYRDMTF